MNIGIDIDGVLTDVRKFTIEAGIKYCKENKKGKLKVKKTIGNKVTLALYIEKWGGVFE